MCVGTRPVAHRGGLGEGVEVRNRAVRLQPNRGQEGEGRIVFRYAEGTNPNGASNDIAGIMSEHGNIIGMMPHPENMIEPVHGSTDCRPLFQSLLEAA